MAEISALPCDHGTWGARYKVMKENIEHDVEEKEGDEFVKARQVFDRSELDDLGEVMAERKREALERVAASAV